MNILIYTFVLGDHSGTQRYVFEFCKAFSNENIDIFTEKISEGDYYPDFQNVKVYDANSFDLQKLKLKHYDIFIQFGKYGYVPGLERYFSSDLKLICPSGNYIFDSEKYFDYVLNQAEDGIKFLREKEKSRVVFPPVSKINTQINKIENLPDKFYFTLFNPYVLNREFPEGNLPVKGYDLLFSISKKTEIPIVWGFEKDIDSEPGCNIIPMKNLSRAQINYAYQNCLSYINFSREEGYGWSVADAILFGCQIITRDIGIISSLGAKKGVQIYSNEKELLELLNNYTGERNSISYDIDMFSSKRYRENIMDIYKEHMHVIKGKYCLDCRD